MSWVRTICDAGGCQKSVICERPIPFETWNLESKLGVIGVVDFPLLPGEEIDIPLLGVARVRDAGR